MKTLETNKKTELKSNVKMTKTILKWAENK